MTYKTIKDINLFYVENGMLSVKPVKAGSVVDIEKIKKVGIKETATTTDGATFTLKFNETIFAQPYKKGVKK